MRTVKQFWLSGDAPHPDEIGGQQGVILRWLVRHPGATAAQVADGIEPELRTRQGARKTVNWYLYRVWPRKGWVAEAGDGRNAGPPAYGSGPGPSERGAGGSLSGRVSTKGQVAIPVRLRRRFGITPGTRIVFLEENGRIAMQPVTPAYLRSFRGAFKLRAGEGSAVNALLEDRRREKTKEDRW